MHKVLNYTEVRERLSALQELIRGSIYSVHFVSWLRTMPRTPTHCGPASWRRARALHSVAFLLMFASTSTLVTGAQQSSSSSSGAGPSSGQCGALPGSTERLFTEFIEPLAPVDFFTRYWEKLPGRVEKDGPTKFSNLLQVSTLHNALRKGLKYEKDVLVVKEGKFLGFKAGDDYPFAAYKHNAGRGATTIFKQVQELVPAVKRFCRLLEHFFLVIASASAVITPAGGAVDPLWDVHDSFVLQSVGSISYTIYKPPPSLVLPRDHNMWKGRLPKPIKQLEKVLEVELEEGDMLYIPRGYIYAKNAPSEESVSLIIGLEASGLAWDNLFAYGITTIMQEDMEYFTKKIAPDNVKVQFWERHRGAEPEEMTLSPGLIIHSAILCVSDQDKSGMFRTSVLPGIKADTGSNLPGIFKILVSKLRLGCGVQDLIPYIDQEESSEVEQYVTQELVEEIMEKYCDGIEDKVAPLLNVMMSIFGMMTGPYLGTLEKAEKNPEKLPAFKGTYKYTGYHRYRKWPNRILVAGADAQGPVVIANGHKIRVKAELFPIVPVIDACIDFKVSDLPTEVPISKKMWFVRKLVQANVLEVLGHESS
eukprot:TRINITY_DN11295_c0_g1_i1.p1 TRINITY_DN11295_c0_g1~~TRINITY_DN11295_c0_g1_i1.p1  ORF type:complete len:591 (-),score=60.07 TRINITY_DN11295_c0_g1_i1:622-2394(-)